MTARHSDVDVLTRAAEELDQVAAAVDDDMASNDYWSSGEHPPHHHPNLYARGVDNGLGGPAGKLAAAFTPDAARDLAAVFRKWARMGRLDPQFLHRTAGPETIHLARRILGETA